MVFYFYFHDKITANVLGGTLGILGARYVNSGGPSVHVAVRVYEISEKGGRISSESSRTKKPTTKGNIFKTSKSLSIPLKE